MKVGDRFVDYAYVDKEVLGPPFISYRLKTIYECVEVNERGGVVKVLETIIEEITPKVREPVRWA